MQKRFLCFILIAGTLIFSGMPTLFAQAANSTWYLNINGQQWGPYDMATLQTLVPTGQLTAKTLVWKEGMAAWVAAGTIPELQSVFYPAQQQPQTWQTPAPAPAQPASTPPVRRGPAASESPTWYLDFGDGEKGPYDMATLQTLVTTRQLTAKTFVWKEGMAGWAAADTVPELRALFTGERASGGPPPTLAQSTTEFSMGKRAGMAASNLVLGLGSYLMGDWVSGAIVTALEGATIGMVFWETSLKSGDPAYLVPGTLVFVTGGVAVVFGIIMPFLYHRTPSTGKTAALMKGLDIELVQAAEYRGPGEKTAPGVRLSYSFQF